MPGDPGLGAGMSDANPHPDKVSGAKGILNGPDPVVSTGSPVLHDFNDTKRQVHIIMNHDHIEDRNFEIGRELPEREPAPVHIGKGFDQKHILAVKDCSGIGCVKTGLVEIGFCFFGNELNYQKTDVVTGPGIGLSRVSQTRYQFEMRG
jgi:hypothetical protein